MFRSLLRRLATTALALAVLAAPSVALASPRLPISESGWGGWGQVWGWVAGLWVKAEGADSYGGGSAPPGDSVGRPVGPSRWGSTDEGPHLDPLGRKAGPDADPLGAPASALGPCGQGDCTDAGPGSDPLG